MAGCGGRVHRDGWRTLGANAPASGIVDHLSDPRQRACREPTRHAHPPARHQHRTRPRAAPRRVCRGVQWATNRGAAAAVAVSSLCPGKPTDSAGSSTPGFFSWIAWVLFREVDRPNTSTDGLRLDGTPVAGWSSPVAREAHNLEVVGSNPTPAISSRPPGHPWPRRADFCAASCRGHGRLAIHGPRRVFLRGLLPQPPSDPLPPALARRSACPSQRARSDGHGT